jgi:hypothetical protein
MVDATSEIYSLFLVDQEGTASGLRGLREVIERHGLFCSLYTDGCGGDILCIQEDRKVGNDNTVKRRRLSLQLPSSRL